MELPNSNPIKNNYYPKTFKLNFIAIVFLLTVVAAEIIDLFPTVYNDVVNNPFWGFYQDSHNFIAIILILLYSNNKHTKNSTSYFFIVLYTALHFVYFIYDPHQNTSEFIEIFSATIVSLLIVQVISIRKKSESQLKILALIDPLTKCYNRRYFKNQLEHHLDLANRYNIEGALFFIDLDQFKKINDSFGHLAGDDVLKTVGARLHQLVRKSDTVARIGGDEFSILFPHTTDIEPIAQRVLAKLQEPIILNSQVPPINLSISIGITLFPSEGLDQNTLLAQADAAMYRVKNSGGNNFQTGPK